MTDLWKAVTVDQAAKKAVGNGAVLCDAIPARCSLSRSIDFPPLTE